MGRRFHDCNYKTFPEWRSQRCCHWEKSKQRDAGSHPFHSPCCFLVTQTTEISKHLPSRAKNQKVDPVFKCAFHIDDIQNVGIKHVTECSWKERGSHGCPFIHYWTWNVHIWKYLWIQPFTTCEAHTHCTHIQMIRKSWTETAHK